MKTNAEARREQYARMLDHISLWLSYIDAGDFEHADVEWRSADGFRRLVEEHAIRGVFWDPEREGLAAEGKGHYGAVR